MRFEGTQQAVELTQGAKSNTYDSIGNADVSFRRNTIDFLYLRNGQVEVNTGLTLYSENAKIDIIDTTSDADMVFKRNGTEFFKLALVFLWGGCLLMLLLIEAMTQTQNLGVLLVEEWMG